MIQLKEKDNWEWKPLKYIFNYFLSSVDRKIKDEELNVHICHYPDVYKNEKISDKDTLNKGTCTEFELENFKLMKGDILITKDSEDPKDIGIPCLVENDLIDSVCGYHIGILRTNENIEREFYFRYIQSTDVKDYFFCESKGITRFGLGKSSVENLKIPILSIKEQKIISQYLDKKTKQIDSLIEKIEKKIELLKEQKNVLVNQYVTKGLNPNSEMRDSGLNWIGEIPKHWKISKMKYLSNIHVQYGLNIESNHYCESGVRFLRITDINQDGSLNKSGGIYLNKSNISDEYILKKGDILFSRTGATVGKSTLIQSDSPLMSFAGYLVRFSFDNYEKATFISFFAKSSSFWSWIDLQITQSTIQNVNGEKYSNLNVPLPPEEEITEINNLLTTKFCNLNEIIEKETSRKNYLKEYRKTLISSVVTGKIQITEDMI